ncbi:uncharacterized protein Dana_GF26339 [Drosophila ananassae]|uniref:Uncharacterized protein n=1 Tax=Drosophila ananassae TaxID=7217 RepID=A0A0N8P1R1_DROAN|nr:uncharacterized protein Dana_GF26339 [Drosophila ananassae]
MNYLSFYWLLLVALLFIGTAKVEAKPKPKPKPGFKFPGMPNLNLNVHHNNVHIG